MLSFNIESYYFDASWWGEKLFNSDGKLMSVMNWITRFIYLQILWVLFSLAGLLVGGLFPSTFTMFGMARKWMREHTDYPVFKTFLQMYKDSFVKTNLLGWGMVLFSFSIYFYFNWITTLNGTISILLIVILSALGLVFLIMSFFIIPVYVHFDVGLLNVIKHALIIAISHPLHILFMAITLIVFWYFMLFLPIIFLFVGISLLAYILMVIANAAFVNVERKLGQ